MGNDLLLDVRDLVKVYDAGYEVRALDGVTFKVHQGEMVAVMGPSGCGKSTLLNIVGALDRPTSGTVRVAGQDVSSIRNVDAFRARMVGFVFQLHNLIPTMTAVENIEVPMQGQGMCAKVRRARAEELLDWVALSHRKGYFPNQLSGGERQRVAIARSLANGPQLILADEPTGNLDSNSGDDVIQLLRRLNAEHDTTVLLVTHNRHVARAMQRVLTMRDGQVVGDYVTADPLTEDLRELARSHLGDRLLKGDAEALGALPFVKGGNLTSDAAELVQMLRELV
jgi:ABC-type lipoprotein export system ATPase subunit